MIYSEKCELKYNHNNIGRLRGNIGTYLRDKDFDGFKSKLLKGEIDKKIRFTLEYSDDLSEINKTIITFYEDLKTIINSIISINPDLIPDINKLVQLINTEFHIDADETQSASIDSDLELKTKEEWLDKNRNNLQDHLKEIYGLESYGILQGLNQDFYDDIIGACYYNSKTGEPVDADNEILNKNIQKLKLKHLNKIKKYLDEKGISYKNNLYDVLRVFYKHIKSIPNLKENLNLLQAKKTKEEYLKVKKDIFKNLLNELESDSNFAKGVLLNLNKYKKNKLNHSLYEGDCYSDSYLSIKKYVLENRPDLEKYINEIEEEIINELEVTNSYSILTHFDEFLINSLGNQIAILEGTKGLDVSDKYSYHLDTSHEIKGWQTSEDIGSEKHTSNFTKGVFSLIRIYDHNTGDYKHKRLNPTSFIIAARHLIDDIIYGNILFQGRVETDYLKKCKNIIIENVMSFHDNPIEKFQQILELLFDTKEGVNPRPIKEFLSNKRSLNNNDLDVLYSVYNKVFNTNNPTSFMSLEIEGYGSNLLGASLMQEVAAYVDSNINIDYLETSVDYETGEINLKVKKKYFNNAQLYRLRKAINSDVNKKSLTQRQKLQDLYEFIEILPADNHTTYLVNINGDLIKLDIKNGSFGKILDGSTNNKFEDSSFFENLNKVDLISFKLDIDNGGIFTGTAEMVRYKTQLKNVLLFIDNYLNLNILSNIGLLNLYIYKDIYAETNNMKNFLMPLVLLAIRSAYINKLYLDAGDLKLSVYLKNDSIYENYKKHPKSKLFVESYGNVKYVATSFNDKALDMWVDSMSILNGEASKPTTKDKQGNSMPNNSVGKLGGNLHYYLHKQRNTNCDTLMFVNDPSLIKSTLHDLEVTNIHGTTKSIKQFSCGELFYHSVFNKFWGNYNKTGNVIILPTVYSDKTTFLNWEIKTDLLRSSDYIDKVIDQYINTLGTFYKRVYVDTMNKLNKIANAYNSDKLSSDPTHVSLSTKEVLKNLTEQLLLNYSKLLSITLEKDKDYRRKTKKVIINGVEKTVEYCAFNEILEYNNRVYNDKQLLKQTLKQEEYNFLLNLIDYNISFQIINFLDDISYYLSKEINKKASSVSPILSTILSYFKNSDERIEFFTNWVDEKTGKLILAKQGNQNILGIGNDFDKDNPELELNPFLNKFFYVEGLLSNNLRMSLTGSEINHPDKAFDTMLHIAKKVNSYGDFVEDVLKNVTFEQYQLIKPILDTCDTVSDLYDRAIENKNSDIGDILMQIYNESITKIINTAQGTLFKRNVIIPATLQYCLQNVKNGISSKIKCAVIYDEKAPVHNYRGETDTVDSADGSALINPFLSILENLSLGSQAVGFVKKPIWHSYDASGGTAFLAKFATTTITNESMRASLESNNSLFKLFKRMTNLRWYDAPIDLTKGIFMNKSLSEDSENETLNKINSKNYNAWFNKVILENLKLFYENKFGDKIQILSFKKTKTKDGHTLYYTLEQNEYNDPVKVYHMFDDESNHYTFNKYDEALDFKLKNGGHTINSLFELHTALGGINCVDSKGNSSEFNNKVVVNFMNNIGTRKEGVSKNALVNQKNYNLPLKEYHIGYALNNTAVKNGAKNINPAKAWKGDLELNYFEVDSDGLGMQMNADHDIINSELTEFSLVIAATSAYGYTYDNCNEIFKGLAKTALLASKQIIDATNNFLSKLDSQAQSDLYDAIGRIMLVERSIKDKETLTNVIMEAVSKIFYKHRNHANDPVKIPYSDPNIHSEFSSLIASNINRSSIKRKHPGSGCVMVPGYNMMTYFEIEDKKYSHKDILNLARTDLKAQLISKLKKLPNYDSESNTIDNLNINYISLEKLLNLGKNYDILNDVELFALENFDIVNINKILIQDYLERKLKKAKLYKKSYFLPEDVIRIINSEGILEKTVVLDSMLKYYDFKNGITEIETKYNVEINSDYSKSKFEISLKNDPKSKIILQKSNESVFEIINLSNTIISKELYNAVIALLPKDSSIYISEEISNSLDPDLISIINYELISDQIKDELGNENIIILNKYTKTQNNLFNYFYQVDVKTPRNLKPASIRWKYINEFDEEVYMNIFDHPVIKESFIKKGKLDAEYRKKLQLVFHDLHNGFFTINDITYKIIPNSLENAEAELIMSNIYKDVFGIENESLQEILDKGEQYFVNQIENNIHSPYNPRYDVSLLKDNGKHTLIKFGEVTTDAYCVKDDFKNISVNKNDEIYCMKGNKPLFKIGKWVYLSDEELNDIQYNSESKYFVSASNKELDQSLYRLSGDRIQKRVDFVSKYKLTTKNTNKYGQTYYSSNVLYKIIDVDELKDIFKQESNGNEEFAKENAHKQIGSLLKSIYKQDDYKFIELNPIKSESHQKWFPTLNSYFSYFLGDSNIDEDLRNYVNQQLDHIKNNPKENFKNLATLKKEFYKKEAHKKWISFLDSLKFISSRIPAQTLLSFMAMKCVGWTENTKNMVYVSHFLTYLQGSDYDIDKAYIMGQSYNDNGIYIKWSPLFDYTNIDTLSLSKQLPIPEKIELEFNENGIDITEELINISKNVDDNLNPLSDEQRIDLLKNYISILNKLNKENGKYYHNLKEIGKIDKIFNKLKQHIYYDIPENIAEPAYKNVASANIYTVSHDVRNRDQGYTAITMEIPRDAAKNSPKGKQAATLNMLNPLTKYIMQYQNLVGKNVISIAANGEKVWFNAYYYWTKLLKEGRTNYLQFLTTLRRVNGRSGLNSKNLKSLEDKAKTTNSLPDLNYLDLELKQNLLQAFDVDLDSEEYAYVDLLISQLLSAATDNAKELILAKINSGNNFARMYVYLIMLGYKFDDIAAFMVSPASEFIDSMANSNMFLDSDLNNNPSSAIDLAKGLIRSKSFLHGVIRDSYLDENTGSTEYKNIAKTKYVLDQLLSSEIISDLNIDMEVLEDMQLDELMLKIIQKSLNDSRINISKLIESDDMEINTYLQYCQNIAYKLEKVANKYENLLELFDDVDEFKKIYQLSTEISGIASAWLGLNQGLPTDELELLQRFSRMRSVIIKREKALGIFSSKIFTNSTNSKILEKTKEEFDKVVTKIIDNNNLLSREFVELKLNEAHEKNLIGTFDVYRYLTDELYKQDMIEYNHLIKGTLNVLSMMEEIPHYKEILNCLKSLAVSKNNLSSKSRLINKLVEDSGLENLTDQQLKGIIRYVDKLTAVNFAKSLKKTIVLKDAIKGFDQYFSEISTDKIDLSTFEGLATFKRWVEHEVLEDLRDNYKHNPLVQHLMRVPENQRDILATDIDLLNPNTTTVTVLSYDEILTGMTKFEISDDSKDYKGSGWTIADILQMYNILVNNNQYGSERLTTAFKSCVSPENILNKYFAFESTLDYDYTNVPDYELIDYYINAAPIVNSVSERFRTDKFIKVNDPVEGYILKLYDTNTNSYKPYQMIPAKNGYESNDDRLQRLLNFAEYCPFEMPTMAKIVEMFSAIDYEGDVNEDIINRIKNILLDFSSIGKIIALKDC